MGLWDRLADLLGIGGKPTIDEQIAETYEHTPYGDVGEIRDSDGNLEHRAYTESYPDGSTVYIEERYDDGKVTSLTETTFMDKEQTDKVYVRFDNDGEMTLKIETHGVGDNKTETRTEYREDGGRYEHFTEGDRTIETNYSPDGEVTSVRTVDRETTEHVMIDSETGKGMIVERSELHITIEKDGTTREMVSTLEAFTDKDGLMREVFSQEFTDRDGELHTTRLETEKDGEYKHTEYRSDGSIEKETHYTPGWVKTERIYNEDGTSEVRHFNNDEETKPFDYWKNDSEGRPIFRETEKTNGEVIQEKFSYSDSGDRKDVYSLNITTGEVRERHYIGELEYTRDGKGPDSEAFARLGDGTRCEFRKEMFNEDGERKTLYTESTEKPWVLTEIIVTEKPDGSIDVREYVNAPGPNGGRDMDIRETKISYDKDGHMEEKTEMTERKVGPDEKLEERKIETTVYDKDGDIREKTIDHEVHKDYDSREIRIEKCDEDGKLESVTTIELEATGEVDLDRVDREVVTCDSDGRAETIDTITYNEDTDTLEHHVEHVDGTTEDFTTDIEGNLIETDSDGDADTAETTQVEDNDAREYEDRPQDSENSPDKDTAPAVNDKDTETIDTEQPDGGQEDDSDEKEPPEDFGLDGGDEDAE